jgi:hypothetical protein
MEILSIPEVLGTFLFMGCWNKNGCKGGQGQAQVAKAIRQEPADCPLFLGGDNVYPDKVDKRKTYSVDRVKDGLACLVRDSPRSVYATIGNHNIADPHVFAAELAAAEWLIRPVSYCLMFRNKAVVFLNSNPLDEDELGEEGRAVLRELGQMLEVLKSAGISYTLIMHHPIVALKKKAGYLMPQHVALLDTLSAYPPRLVLVADTHNYQHGIVEWRGMRLQQFVVGTGGADLDPISYNDPIPFGGIYTLLDAVVEYGYLRVFEHGFEFVRLLGSPRSPRSPRGSPKTRKNRRPL